MDRNLEARPISFLNAFLLKKDFLNSSCSFVLLYKEVILDLDVIILFLNFYSLIKI